MELEGRYGEGYGEGSKDKISHKKISEAISPFMIQTNIYITELNEMLERETNFKSPREKELCKYYVDILSQNNNMVYGNMKKTNLSDSDITLKFGTIVKESTKDSFKHITKPPCDSDKSYKHEIITEEGQIDYKKLSKLQEEAENYYSRLLEDIKNKEKKEELMIYDQQVSDGSGLSEDPNSI